MATVLSLVSSRTTPDPRPSAEVLSALLAARGLADFARQAAPYLEAKGVPGVALGWRGADGARHVHDPAASRPADAPLAEAARTDGWAADAGRRRVACRIDAGDGDAGLVLLADGTPEARALLESHAAYLAPIASVVLETSKLTDSMARLARSEQLQSALFQIADMASSDMDLGDMLRELHAIVGRFMYAENFYIALYDDERRTVRFIYFADAYNLEDYDPNKDVPIEDLRGGLTWYVLHDRKSLMGSLESIKAQISGPMRGLGGDCYDWLGVPIIVGERVRGVLVVQSYIERPRYTAADQTLLAYVGSHILTALDRKLAQEELERRVAERTQALQLEVQERQRSVRIQEALYRIAELSHTATNLDEFYAAVHRIVGEFLDASNFYIALLSDDGEMLHFPYYVDETRTTAESRKPARGISEYAMRLGKPLLLDMTDPDTLSHFHELESRGELNVIGTKSVAWLGAPLVIDERVRGLLAVQSYTSGVGYTDRDRELLTFISYQIANGLQRQHAALALRDAYLELEGRVASRTAELSEQIRVREQVEQRLKHQVLHDSLTGLPNRAYLREQLLRALARCEREPDYRFAVLFMDLDRFKVINDSMGHLVGDALLVEVARRFTHCTRGQDMVARLGGDEFAILMDVAGSEGAVRMARRVLEALRDPVRVHGKELFTGASVGIALSASRYTSPEELLRDADIAMYRAKAAGRHRFELFDERLHDQALQLLETESDLRRAVAREEFVPYFQPIVRLADATVVGYEALARWQHPERGVLSPAAFLHVAEASGTVEAVDWLVLERVLRKVPSLLCDGQFVNVNLSPRHFRNVDTDDRILALIERHGVRPDQVRLEVTEGALLEYTEQTTRLFARLQERGVRIALDDFGTGYSSLSYLHRFRMHTLKIDRSFVGDLQPDAEGGSTAVVRAILALSRAHGMDVVAEGIETEEQRRALLALGCELGQGYLFARPQALADLLVGR